MADVMSFVAGAVVGLTAGWLLWTETGKMITGTSKEVVKSDLRARLEALERSR